MGDDGSVLSQAEIDALFRQATGTNIARPAASVPVAQPPPVAEPPPIHVIQAQATTPPTTRVTVLNERLTPPRAADYVEVKSLVTEQQTQLNALVRRIAQLEISLGEIAKSVSHGGTGNPGTANVHLTELSSTLRRVVKQTAGIQKGLDATPAYNLAHEFTCSECGSHGHMATPVSCTACGKEGWWGWWPKDG